MVDFEHPGPQREIGVGIVVGTSIDGTAVYVENDRAFVKPECDTGSVRFLSSVVSRLTLDTGKIEPLVRDDRAFRGTLVRGPDRKVAFVEACGAATSSIYTAVETPDGRLRDVRKVPPLHPTELVPGPGLVAWSADGESLIGATSPPGDSTDPVLPQVARLDPRTGELSPLFAQENPISFDPDNPAIARGITKLAQLQDGTLLVGTAQRGVGRRSTDGSYVGYGQNGHDFTLHPDRRWAAILGSKLVVRLPRAGTDSDTLVGVDDHSFSFGSAEFSPDGRWLVIEHSKEGNKPFSIKLVRLADRRMVDLGGPVEEQLSRPVFTGDGSAVVFNRLDRRAPTEPRVVAVPLTAAAQQRIARNPGVSPIPTTTTTTVPVDQRPVTDDLGDVEDADELVTRLTPFIRRVAPANFERQSQGPPESRPFSSDVQLTPGPLRSHPCLASHYLGPWNVPVYLASGTIKDERVVVVGSSSDGLSLRLVVKEWASCTDVWARILP